MLGSFRAAIDAVHADLARQGHPDVRPVHGFVLQAVGPDSTTAVELGRRLDITKQAAAKHVEFLEQLGYLERTTDPHDTRRRTIRLTSRGLDCLHLSAAAFERVRQTWSDRLGEERLRAVEDALRVLTADSPLRVDLPGWLGT